MTGVRLFAAAAPIIRPTSASDAATIRSGPPSSAAVSYQQPPSRLKCPFTQYLRLRQSAGASPAHGSERVKYPLSAQVHDGMRLQERVNLCALRRAGGAWKRGAPVLPVKEILSTSGCPVRAAPAVGPYPAAPQLRLSSSRLVAPDRQRGSSLIRHSYRCSDKETAAAHGARTAQTVRTLNQLAGGLEFVFRNAYDCIYLTMQCSRQSIPRIGREEAGNCALEHGRETGEGDLHLTEC